MAECSEKMEKLVNHVATAWITSALANEDTADVGKVDAAATKAVEALLLAIAELEQDANYEGSWRKKAEEYKGYEDSLRLRLAERDRKIADLESRLAEAEARDKRLKEAVIELYGRRDCDCCWWSDDDGDTGDCGNWPDCQPDCPIVWLRDLAGIKPRKNGEVKEG